MESVENWILRGCHRTLWNRNGKRKGRWSAELANTKEHQRSQKILRTCQLLQEIHKIFCKNSETNELTNQEGCEMAVGEGARISI